MKTTLTKIKFDAAYAALPVVITIGMFAIGSLTYVFQKSSRAHRQQVNTQVKVDYAQKEDAVLRALVSIVPNRAINAMQANSSNASNLTWDKIFEDAISLGNADHAVDADILASINVPNLILANTGDTDMYAANSTSIVDSIVKPIVGSTGTVNAGNTRDTAMVNSSEFGSSLPAALYTNNTNFNRDKTFPLIGPQKRYVNSSRQDVRLDANTHRHFNLIPYPDIRFGYARPGEDFIAKRNWWAFSLTFGANNSAATGVPPLTKNYLLSIYEIPTQLPISAGNFMSVGAHSDGTAWENATVTGGLFANELQTEGDLNIAGGSLSGRRTLDLSTGTTVSGSAVESNIDGLGVREALLANSDSDFYDVSLSGNSGRVAIVPLNTGEGFLRWMGGEQNTLSPQKFSRYANGAVRCRMRVRVMEVQSDSVQIPTWIRFYYRKNGSSQWQDFKRSDGTWPISGAAGGDEFPFQTEELAVGRHSLTVYMNRLHTYLASIGAEDPSSNYSLYIYPDGNRTDVRQPSIPSTSDDLAVTIRDSEDLTAFTSGFSLVTDCRLYFAGSFNQVSTTPPANSGLPTGFEFYPPISIFSPEKRYGIHFFDRDVDFEGQLSSLKTDETSAYRPLDFMSGGDEAVSADKIDADLKRLISPAQLPPISIMNWMVTIEELQ